MEIIRAIQLKNKGVFVARLRVKNSSGAVVTSQNIIVNKSATIDLNQHLNKFNDGDTITVGVVVVGGRNKTSSRQFIYRAGAQDKAMFEISGTTLSNKLKFVETKYTYPCHFIFDDNDSHLVNGINYGLFPEESIAIVCEHPEEGYKGAVKIPSTITYQRKKYVVTEIGNQAFGYSHELTSVTLPASICFIHDFGFKQSNLKTLRVETDTPPFAEAQSFQEFENIENCTLQVPLGSVGIYRKALCWEQFKNIKAYWNRSMLDKIGKMIEKNKSKEIKKRPLPEK